MKDPARARFVYRDRLWEGADLVGLGVASFGHVNGVHMQNLDKWETYSGAVRRDGLALGRAYRPTDDERLIREFVLQLKRGWIRPAYFREKYGVNVARTIPRAAGVARGRRVPRERRRRIGSRCRARDSCAWTSCCGGSSCRSTSDIRYT